MLWTRLTLECNWAFGVSSKWFLAEMMLEEKTRIGLNGLQSAQDTCRSKEGWLALRCANLYPKSQSVVFIQTLIGFDFWNVEDYGRLGAVGDTSVPFWSWPVHFLGSQKHETRPTLLLQLFAKIFSTKKVGNQESNQIFQVFPATFSLERIVVLPTRWPVTLRCACSFLILKRFLSWQEFFETED